MIGAIRSILFPCRNWTGESPLSAGRIHRNLSGLVGDKVWRLFPFVPSGDSAPYHGTVEDLEFRATRNIGYRNSFLPTARGRLLPGPDSCTVRLTLRMHPGVELFSLVWMSGPALVLVLALRGGMRDAASTGIGILFPVGMIAFLQVLTRLAFGFEVSRYRKDFQAACGTTFRDDP